MLGQALDRLEAQALTARSATNEEAQLRGREAELVLQFTGRARQIEPRGQLVLPDPTRAGDTPLEDGDTLFVPERSAQVAVHGEVLFPMAIGHDPARRVDDYLRLAGGPSQQADTSRVLLLKRNGTVVESRGDVVPDPGDELMVLPRAETKRVEVARGITQVLYQIAVVAKVALGL
jgi:protein involved in polysaccharide export with SLBB domain